MDHIHAIKTLTKWINTSSRSSPRARATLRTVLDVVEMWMPWMQLVQSITEPVAKKRRATKTCKLGGNAWFLWVLCWILLDSLLMRWRHPCLLNLYNLNICSSSYRSKGCLRSRNTLSLLRAAACCMACSMAAILEWKLTVIDWW